MIAYESHLEAFTEKIEKATISHSMFWSFLIDEYPDMSQFSSTAFKIQFLVQSIEGRINSRFKIDRALCAYAENQPYGPKSNETIQ
jgi:hypothetical protein